MQPITRKCKRFGNVSAKSRRPNGRAAVAVVTAAFESKAYFFFWFCNSSSSWKSILLISTRTHFWHIPPPPNSHLDSLIHVIRAHTPPLEDSKAQHLMTCQPCMLHGCCINAGYVCCVPSTSINAPRKREGSTILPTFTAVEGGNDIDISEHINPLKEVTPAITAVKTR